MICQWREVEDSLIRSVSAQGHMMTRYLVNAQGHMTIRHSVNAQGQEMTHVLGKNRYMSLLIAACARLDADSLDVEGHAEDEIFGETISELKNEVSFFRILGSYPKHIVSS